MRCLECEFETTIEDDQEASVEMYKHVQAEHPEAWQRFMDWVLN
jgi:predicted small metal-binding protein